VADRCKPRSGWPICPVGKEVSREKRIDPARDAACDRASAKSMKPATPELVGSNATISGVCVRFGTHWPYYFCNQIGQRFA
jgi:hypothetical protein